MKNKIIIYSFLCLLLSSINIAASEKPNKTITIESFYNLSPRTCNFHQLTVTETLIEGDALHRKDKHYNNQYRANLSIKDNQVFIKPTHLFIPGNKVQQLAPEDQIFTLTNLTETQGQAILQSALSQEQKRSIFAVDNLKNGYRISLVDIPTNTHTNIIAHNNNSADEVIQNQAATIILESPAHLLTEKIEIQEVKQNPNPTIHNKTKTLTVIVAICTIICYKYNVFGLFSSLLYHINNLRIIK